MDTCMKSEAHLSRPRIPLRRHVSGHTGDTESLATIKSWLESCDEHHSCRSIQLTSFPTRILDISSSTIRVIEGKLIQAQYAALSHRWGKGHPVRLLQSTIPEYIHGGGVPWTSLSGTSRDAITTARALGLHYLWIDSLCIVQDDDDDWSGEAGRMAQVYR